MLSKSLETLAVRVDKHCENAMKVAEFLENHPQVNWVKYPFMKSHPQYEVAKKQMKLGGNIVAFEVKGGIEAGRKFLNAIKMCSLWPIWAIPEPLLRILPLPRTIVWPKPTG